MINEVISKEEIIKLMVDVGYSDDQIIDSLKCNSSNVFKYINKYKGKENV